MLKLLGVRPEEQKRLAVFYCLFLILAMGVTVGATTALSLFITRYGVDYLPHMFILTSLVALLVTPVYNNFLGKISNEKYFIIILAINAASILGVWFVIQTGFKQIYLILYIFYSLIAWLSYSHTFVMVYDYFDAQESKRLFPLIVSGISLGGIIGGFGVKFLLGFMSTESLLLVWVGFFGLAGVAVAAIKLLGLESVVKRKEEKKKKSTLGFFEAFKANFKTIIKFPLVRMLVFSTAVTNAFFIADYLSSKVFAQAFPEEAQLTAFLGMFTAVANIVGLVVQMGLLSRLIAWTGVANANFIYPGMTFSGMAMMVVWPALPAACLAFFNRRFLSYAVGEPVERLIYNGLPAQMKGRATAFVKGYIEPVSTVVVSGLIIVVNMIFADNQAMAFTILAGVGFVVSTGNLYQRYLLKRLYTESLVSMIKERKVDLQSLAEDWKKGQGATSDIPIEEYLASEDEALFALTLEFIRSARIKEYAPKIKEALPGKSVEMQLEALRTLARISGQGDEEFFLELARRGDPRIRAESIKLLADMGDHVYDELVELLSDPEEDVQSAAIVVICKSGDIFHMTGALNLLSEMLQSAHDEEFLRGVNILVEINDRRYIKPLAGFLKEDRSIAARTYIIKAMGTLETGENEAFIDIFHRLLEHERGVQCGYVMDALKKIASKKSIEPITAVMNSLNMTNRLKAVDVLESVGARSVDALTQIVRDQQQDHQVRIACLSSLEKITSSIDSTALKNAISEETENLYTLVMLKMKLAENGVQDEMLSFTLDEMQRMSIVIWLHTVARMTKKSGEVIMLVEPLQGKSKNAKANALETLENLLDKKMYRMICPVFDGVSERECLAAACKVMEIPDRQMADLFVQVMENASASHFAYLLYTAGTVLKNGNSASVQKAIEKALGMGTPECAEAAILAASRVGIIESYRTQINELAESPDPELENAVSGALKYVGKGDTVMLSTFEKMMFLKKVETFSDLDSHGLKVISGISTEVEYSQGEIVFEEQDQGDAMYVIHKGKVRLYLKSNRDKPLVVLGESAYFGEMAVLDGEPRSASAAADTDCRLIRIQRDHFIELIHEYPMITLPIFQALSRRLREAQK